MALLFSRLANNYVKAGYYRPMTVHRAEMVLVLAIAHRVATTSIKMPARRATRVAA